MTENDLPFQFEQHGINRFDHGIHTVIMGIILQGKQGQWPQADAIAAFQDFHVMVAHIVAQHVRNARRAACRSTHPEDIVVAPLNIEGMVLHEVIHNLIGMRPPVVNIANNVQMVYSQPFY